MGRKVRVRKLLMASSSDGTAAAAEPPNPLLSSRKYKAYVQDVERALKNFENITEWADLISALGKLAKVFQSNSKYGDIPKPVLVSKRLSQCLHPALPMGVHLKALETYKQIFDILGPQLPRLLYLFAVGLFPLMDHCGIKVKSELFNVFEQYLVPLGPKLRPALPGFLAGVLLGVDEGTEFFERSIKMLDRVAEGVGPTWFYTCLWKAVLGSPSVRLPAMLYVNAKFDKSKSMEEQKIMMGEDVELMVSALCVTSEDTGSPLVQRHLLDFLCSAFPLDSTLFSREDFVQLLRRCLFVVLRRDMSLNRRLYTWLMNPTGGAVPISSLPVGDDRVDSSFFEEKVLSLTVDSLSEYLELDTIELPSVAINNWAHGWGEKKDHENVQFTEVRVCRLLTYLQDRADIGQPLLFKVFPILLSRCADIYPDVELPVFELDMEKRNSNPSSPLNRLTLDLKITMSQSSISAHSPDFVSATQQERRLDEIGKTLNLLVASLENGFLWEFLGGWFEKSISNPDRSDLHMETFAKVTILCLNVCGLDGETAIRKRYLPILLKRLLTGVRDHLDVISTTAVVNIVFVASQIFQCSCATTPVDVTSGVQSESSASATTSPVKSLTSNNILDRDQEFIENCVENAFSLLTSLCGLYERDSSVHPHQLFHVVSRLITQFLDFPIYCLDTDDGQDSGEFPKWLRHLLNVLNAEQWAVNMSNGNYNCLELKVAVLELLTNIYLRSISILAQHEAIATRRSSSDSDNEAENSPTTVLLKPLIKKNGLDVLESERLFELCGSALWYGLRSVKAQQFHFQLARLLVLLHSRKPSEPSSDLENVIISSLASSDPMVATEAACTFQTLSSLARGIEEPLLNCGIKPFNRAILLLLGILADESVSRARSELKSAAAAWFIDCATHNDLPRIVQMLCTMLMNPVTARISIQYLRKESRIAKEQLSALPTGVSAVTLLTADGKQRLYHVDGMAADSSWQSDLRNRLLMQSNNEHQPAAPAESVATAVGDCPHFDDEADSLSLDTLSISVEGIDPAVVETVVALIDAVVEEEESEIENLRYIQQVVNDVPIEGQSIYFSSDESSIREPEAPREQAVNVRSRSKSRERQMDSIARIKKGHRRQDSLQESIFSMTEKDLKAFDAADLLRPSTDGEGEALFHELHVHMLLYGESGRVVDLGRAETAFRILTALLNPRAAPISNHMLLCCLVSSGTAAQSNESNSMSGSLVELMGRHVRAILGQHFWALGSEEEGTKHRHLTLLELLLTVSLHFLRSYFLNSPVSTVSEADLTMAWKCKIAVLEFLSELLSEVAAMVAEQQSKSFVQFIQAILLRAKLQKCLLHLLLSAVHDPRNATENGQGLPLSVSIAEFNEGAGSAVGQRLSGLLMAYHRSLLSLTAQAIRLEYEIKNGLMRFTDKNGSLMLNRLSINQQLYNLPNHRGTIRDSHLSLLVELRAFLLVVLKALKWKPENNELWMQFIVQILPWMDRSLPTIVVRVVEQLCKNVEIGLSAAYKVPFSEIGTPHGNDPKEVEALPANFIVTTLETITTLVHYCVVDTLPSSSPPAPPPTQVATANSSGGATSVVGQAMSVIPGTKGATELFSNLVKVFSFSEANSNGVITKLDVVRNSGGENWRQAKNDMLTSLPHALATICDVWSVVRKGKHPDLPLGSPEQLHKLVIDLLSPLAQNHQPAFLQALSLVWLSRSNSETSPRKTSEIGQATFTYTESQLDVANLLLSLKVIAIEDLMSAVCETLKDAGAKVSKFGPHMDKLPFPTEAPLLELVHGCVRTLPPAQLRACWSSVATLFSDVPVSSLQPRAVFLLFIILCDFVRVLGASYIVEEKTLSRAMQDSVQRLTEAVNNIVGWQLETTTWLKRTLVVKDQTSGTKSVDASPSVEFSTPLGTPGFPHSEQNSNRGSTLSLIPKTVDGSIALHQSLPEKKSSSNLRGSVKDSNNNKRDPAHSTQALFLLAENLAELVDSVCKSDDKERLLPTLHAVWNNVVPYFRAKSLRNAKFFLASSQLLASMSSFTYMRPVWKKTGLELLLDSSFFKMDVSSLKQWLVITDHLMTHDKTSFKDLLKSIAYTPGLMTTKDQEYESRALAVKRLAFVVFSSELDQYQAQMNDVQERLAEHLRVSQSPIIRAAVFLCLRVLLLRLKPPSLVGIWPIMVAELVHVLLQLEQHLGGDAQPDEPISTKDDVGSWLHLYLSASKLLECLCSLPSGYLAQFQMCHWTFVNSFSSTATNESNLFIPFAARINKLLHAKFGPADNQTFVTLSNHKTLSGFEDLQPFFRALSTPSLAKELSLTGTLSYKKAVSKLESGVYIDFAENWQS